ncbi:hypothetical protein Lesp02_35940 [Lentzea sp. NBRC 105346]|uniref:hypothetical protein n=1 Tax=Lentzea sp. NBRC 105346 TaxID=3032205 RepID=UPI0024A116E8|nr:hypothetical protein [Lentzea sp. NBRC 105346]GLZ31406.1 hypothetical protein Lesp02_35940 [Lentzea sp. NBRC 105346]
MGTRRTANPNQLALWGRYELGDLAMAKHGRKASTLPEVELNVTEPVRLTPVFRPAVDLTPIFMAPSASADGQSYREGAAIDPQARVGSRDLVWSEQDRPHTLPVQNDDKRPSTTVHSA